MSLNCNAILRAACVFQYSIAFLIGFPQHQLRSLRERALLIRTVQYRDRQAELIEKYDDYDNYRAGLISRKEKMETELRSLCSMASKVRSKYAEDLSDKMEKAMADLNFLASTFRI